VTADGVLTAALNIAYFAVFGFTLNDYLRHRDSVRLAVVLMFGSLALVLAVSVVRVVLPDVGRALGIVSLPAFLAQPLFVLWLVHHFRPVPRPLFLAAGGAFLGLCGLMVALWMVGVTSIATPVVIVLLLLFVAYFVLLELGAAAVLALEARRRSGASRLRLAIAALSTGLFGFAILVLLGAGVAAAGSPAAAAVNVIVRFLALVAAAGYLAAFAPPRALRRLGQQTIAYAFIRELNQLPPESGDRPIWGTLMRYAHEASGARRVELTVAGDPPSSFAEGDLVGSTGTTHRIGVPIRSDDRVWGRLDLLVTGSPLFVDDDLELIGLLADRAARAAERDDFVQERERLIADLQAASAAKSEFLAAMSHELRTPLNAIIGFSELLLEPGSEPTEAATVAEYADHIHRSGLHLLELINDVLDLARVEAGHLDLKPVEFGLDYLLGQTVETMRPLAARKSISLRLAPSEPVGLRADPARIRQVVFNLLSNAIKFSADGDAVTVAVEADDAEIRIRVSDTGPGIAPAEHERIFEAFQQAGTSGPARSEGTGLGLALSRQLVEAHDGTIELRSELGQGSAFIVHLPRSRPGEGLGLPSPAAGERPLVLVVEDDAAAAELLRIYLEGAGYAVAIAGTGREGLVWAEELHPSAVILDILLPDLDGWEILQRLKRRDPTRSIPVLVVSVVDDRPLGLALGAVDYFVKPIARDPLLAALGRLTFTTKVKSRTITALVIDADPAAGGRYRQILEPEGFRVRSVTSGAAGREMARRSRPDLILLDMLLPDIDGFALVAQLKEDAATGSIPIWVTTPENLSVETKSRLNGHVIGIADRGDAAFDALRRWLDPTSAARQPAATP
jgi:signal transduction histidine kinase/DNA-binding response OmpR family regulator